MCIHGPAFFPYENGFRRGLYTGLDPSYCSVVDPNALNLDPDPGFWPNLDPVPDPGTDPDPGLCYKF